jgi:hypothetical protein
MNLTPHHIKYFAHELTRSCSSESAEKVDWSRREWAS